jgi:hypothetical protein
VQNPAPGARGKCSIREGGLRPAVRFLLGLNPLNGWNSIACARIRMLTVFWMVRLWEAEVFPTWRLIVFDSPVLALHCDVRTKHTGIHSSRVHEIVDRIALCE